MLRSQGYQPLHCPDVIKSNLNWVYNYYLMSTFFLLNKTDFKTLLTNFKRLRTRVNETLGNSIIRIHSLIWASEADYLYSSNLNGDTTEIQIKSPISVHKCQSNVHKKSRVWLTTTSKNLLRTNWSPTGYYFYKIIPLHRGDLCLRARVIRGTLHYFLVYDASLLRFNGIDRWFFAWKN